MLKWEDTPEPRKEKKGTQLWEGVERKKSSVQHEVKAVNSENWYFQGFEDCFLPRMTSAKRIALY